jgi:hypothetical protein
LSRRNWSLWQLLWLCICHPNIMMASQDRHHQFVCLVGNFKLASKAAHYSVGIASLSSFIPLRSNVQFHYCYLLTAGWLLAYFRALILLGSCFALCLFIEIFHFLPGDVSVFSPRLLVAAPPRRLPKARPRLWRFPAPGGFPFESLEGYVSPASAGPSPRASPRPRTVLWVL